MRVSKENFHKIAADLNLPPHQTDAFWSRLEEQDVHDVPFSKYLFYFGALIVISALTWFAGIGWEIFGGLGIFLIASAYAILFAMAGKHFWDKKGLRIPSGLFITMAVCLVPLAVYGLETYFNLWPSVEGEGKYRDFYFWVEGRWIWMELATIFAGVLALRFFPFPFLIVPILVATWYLILDSVPLIFGKNATQDQTFWLLLVFGLVILAMAIFLDYKQKSDYAFWCYLFGTLFFWSGLNVVTWDKGELARLIYLVINIALMCLSVLLSRNVLMVFGALGVFAYLSWLAYDVFQDSILFPFALSFIGLAIIYLGFLYQKNASRIESALKQNMPQGIKNFLDELKSNSK